MRPRGPRSVEGNSQTRPALIVSETQELVFLCKDDLVRLNSLVLEQEQDDPTVKVDSTVINLGLLEGIVEGQSRKVFGYDPYPSLCDKAAYLLVNLAYHQCFCDGNKRTAWEACRVFLSLNHVSIYYNSEIAADICLEIALLRETLPNTENIDPAVASKIRELSGWIKDNSFEMPPAKSGGKCGVHVPSVNTLRYVPTT